MNDVALRLAALLFDQPLIQNQFRSAFVEAMIEPYLARSGWRYVGGNWAGWDFEHKLRTRLELKQSAAWQTWDPPKRGYRRNPDLAFSTLLREPDGSTKLGRYGPSFPRRKGQLTSTCSHGMGNVGTPQTIATLINGSFSFSPQQLCRRKRPSAFVD
jgi:hypothetical protein